MWKATPAPAQSTTGKEEATLQREGRPQDAPRPNQHSSMAPNQPPLADLTDFLAAAIKKIESSQTQLEEKIGRRLRQVDQDQADLANGICTLTEQHRSLQAENESLNEDVKYLSARCKSLQQYCENLYDWQDHLSSATRELDGHLDRLDAFLRKNNLRFVNVHEGPGEDYKSCARKVVQLLNRFFPFKTWRPEDLEQAHRVGPKRKDGSRPRTLVARFHTWLDKLSLLEEKDARKDMADTYGIRMAADLTDRQHKELKRQKDQGRTIATGACASKKNGVFTPRIPSGP